MKILEYDMTTVEYIKNTLIICNQVNLSILGGQIEDPLLSQSLIKDNTRRIMECVYKLTNLHESMSEYEELK